MTCPNATAPINLNRNQAGNCILKCDYEQHYKQTSVSAENKGNYIRYSFTQSDTPPVTFNTEKYNVSEMRLYRPSLHRYGGKQCDAELMIDHTNISQNTGLLVCIPIVDGGDSSGVFDELISQVAARANSTGGITTIGSPSFSIGNIVPNKPFYSYTGTMPVIPCIGTKKYIVFDKENAIKISGKNLVNLKNIITEHNYSVQKNSEGFYYNKNGPSKGTGEDDIYIECSPTGEDKTNETKSSNNTTTDINTFFKQPVVKYLLIGVGILLMLFAFRHFFGSYIKNIFLYIKTEFEKLPPWIKNIAYITGGFYIFCAMIIILIIIISLMNK